MLPWVQIKGHLSFYLGHTYLEFFGKSISEFGVTGLSWGTINPQEYFGHVTRVTLQIPAANPPLEIKTLSIVIRELSAHQQYMGLKFQLDDLQKAALAGAIAQYGFYPTDYVRKYPRIPASSLIQTFPLHVLGLYENSSIVFDVSNLSPNGILLSTENPRANSIRLGNRLDLILEPRGYLPSQIKIQGIVCRTLDEVNVKNDNLTRHFGIKFTKIDEVNKAAFLEVLKDILQQLKFNPPLET